jgi:hypothetical protein
MHCGRIWAFDENLERRTDHGSAKSAFAVRPSLADITSLPSCLANYRSLGATEASNSNCHARVAPRSSCLQFSMYR